MEDRRFVETTVTQIILVTGAMLMLPQFAGAYEVSAHSALSEALITQYEQRAGNVFTATEEQALIRGSVEEDDNGRFFSHFYDPQNNVGLPLNSTSPEWSVDILGQANWGVGRFGIGGLLKTKPLFSGNQDHSWQRAVYEYVHGDRVRAIESLGHVIHLLQDATVPAHVRGDVHPFAFGLGDRDSYEEFTRDKTPDGALRRVEVAVVSSPQEAISEVAIFTQKNFLSKDTLFKKYAQPARGSLELERARADGANQYFGIGAEGKIVRIKQERDNKEGSSTQDTILEEFFLSDKYNEILTENWTRLSRKATAYSMGLIDLFFKEVEKERQVGTLLAMNKSRVETERFVRALAIERDDAAGSLSSLAAADAYELNKEDFDGYFDAAEVYGIHVPAIARASPLKDEESVNNSQPASALLGLQQATQSEESQQEQASSQEAPTPETTEEPFEATTEVTNEEVEENPIPQTELVPETETPTLESQTPTSPFAPGGFGFGGGGGGSTSSTESSSSTTTSTTSATSTVDTTPPDAPTITTPGDFSTTFYSESFDFEGTAEATSTISFFKNGSLITTTNTLDTGLWALAGMVLEEGSHDISFTAIDSSGNVSSSTDKTVEVRLIPETPTLTSPTSTNIATTSVLFEGLATEGNTLTGTVGTTTATTTVGVDGVWSLGTFLLEEGETAVSFFQTDALDGDESLLLEEAIIVDTIAPATTTLEVLECTFTLRSDGECLSGTEEIHLVWEEVVEAHHYGITIDGVEQSTTTATSSTALLPDQNTSDVLVRVYDAAGNMSESNSLSVEVFAQPVVIMEVAWAGTLASADDEWIELVNRTPYRMNMDMLEIAYGNSTSTIALSGFVSSSAFYGSRSYVIERGDGSATTFSEKLAIDFESLSDSGEHLLLQLATSTLSSIIDQTPEIATCGGWCGGSATSTTSMERVGEDSDGSLAESWQTFDGYVLSDYRDSAGGELEGTPAKENSEGYPEFGYFCTPYTESFEEDGTYSPSTPGNISTKNCTYLTALWEAGLDRKGAVFVGEIGAATSTNGHSLAGIYSTENGDITEDLENGDTMFIAFWKQYTGPSHSGDDEQFINFFEGTASSTPHSDYRTLNWTYSE